MQLSVFAVQLELNMWAMLNNAVGLPVSLHTHTHRQIG